MRYTFVIFSLVTTLSCNGPAEAAETDLQETGQTLCFGATGVQTDCFSGGAGQDGDYRRGVRWPDPRFERGSGGERDCITDNLTGLMWVRAPNTSVTRSWQDTLNAAAGQTICGLSGWRVPNVNELLSLFHLDEVDVGSYLEFEGGFVGVDVQTFWSSTTYAPDPTRAWVVQLRGSGQLTAFDKSGIVAPPSTLGEFFMWLVRDAQ